MTRTTDSSIHTQGSTIAEQKQSDLKNRLALTEQAKHTVLVSIHQNQFPDSQYRGAQVFYNRNPSGRILAENIQKEWNRVLTPESHRKIQRAEGIYLMEHCRCPAVLVECGFLSNPEEEAALRSETYQKKISCVLASVLSFSDCFA